MEILISWPGDQRYGPATGPTAGPLSATNLDSTSAAANLNNNNDYPKELTNKVLHGVARIQSRWGTGGR